MKSITQQDWYGAIVAVLLAFIPYLLLRGPFARLARIWGVGDATAATKDKRS